MTLKQVLIMLATASSALPRNIFFRPIHTWKIRVERSTTSPFTSPWNMVRTQDDTTALLLKITPNYLPFEANGDKELVSRLLKLPKKHQPSWLISWHMSAIKAKNATRNYVATTTKNCGFKLTKQIYVATSSQESSSIKKSSKDNDISTDSTTPIYITSTKSDRDLKEVRFKPFFHILQKDISRTKKHGDTLSSELTSSTNTYSKKNYTSTGGVTTAIHDPITISDTELKDRFRNIIGQTRKFSEEDIYIEGYTDKETPHKRLTNGNENYGIIELIIGVSNKRTTEDYVYGDIEITTAAPREILEVEGTTQMMSLVTAVVTPILKSNISEKQKVTDKQLRLDGLIDLVTSDKSISKRKHLDEPFPNAYKDYQQISTSQEPHTTVPTFSQRISRFTEFKPFQKLLSLVKREGKQENYPIENLFSKTNPKLSIHDIDTSYIDISDFKTTAAREFNDGPNTHEFFSLINPNADEKSEHYPRPFKMNWNFQESTENPLFPNAIPVKSTESLYRLPYQKINWFNNPTTLESDQVLKKVSGSLPAEDEATLVTQTGATSKDQFPFNNDGTAFPNSSDDDSIYKLPYAYPNPKDKKLLIRFTERTQGFDRIINSKSRRRTKATTTSKQPEVLQPVTSPELLQTPEPRMKYRLHDINKHKSHVAITDFVKQTTSKPMTTQEQKFESFTSDESKLEIRKENFESSTSDKSKLDIRKYESLTSEESKLENSKFDGKLRFCDILIPNELTTTSSPNDKTTTKCKTIVTTEKQNSRVNSNEDVDYSLILYNVRRTTIKTTLDPKRVPLMKNSRPIRNEEIGTWHDNDESPQYFDYEV